MKALVIEIHENTATMLSDDGCIRNVKNRNYEIGQEVDTIIRPNFKKKAAITAAAAALFTMVIGGGAAAYYTPTDYVSLDVNPSIEYEVNMFGRVISVHGVNDDGSEIIGEIDLDNLIGQDINEAITLTVGQIAEVGYFADGGGQIVITTSSGNMEEADELAQELEETASEAVEDSGSEAQVNGEAVGRERVLEAQELGVTPGKLNLVEKLIESSSDPESIDMEEWLNKSVKDIMKQIKENREAAKAGQDTGEQSQEQTQEQAQEQTGTSTDTTGNNGNGNSSNSDNSNNSGNSETGNSGNSDSNNGNSGNNSNNGNSNSNSNSNNGSGKNADDEDTTVTGNGSNKH